MTINIEDIKRDREAGTGGPWRVRENARHSQDVCDVSICGDIFVLADITGPQYVHQIPNARRIARVPDLEAAFLDAVETLERCAKIVSRYNGRQNEKIDDVPYLVRQFLERNT